MPRACGPYNAETSVRLTQRADIFAAGRRHCRGVRRLCLVFGCCLLCLGAAAPQWLGRFSASDLTGWAEHRFSGLTRYTLGDAGSGIALQAVSQGTASALYHETRVDLTRTPVLHWRWRVDHGPTGLDELSRGGDDYAARLYVVYRRGLLRKPFAINYVWSGSQARGASWPNAWLPEHSIMVAVRGTQDKTGHWYAESRNVREDFRRLLGVDIDHIDVVVLMSDTDNQLGSAEAWYGDSYFAAE